MKALSIVLAVVAACLLALIAVFWFGGALEAEVAIAPVIAGDEALAAFCSAVQAWATSAFRHRFSAGRGAVSVKKARGKGDNT